MTHRPGLARMVVWLSVLTVTAAGCGSDSDGSDDSEPDGAPVGEYSVAEALTQVPSAAAEDPLIQTADLRTASELAGLEYPTSGSREDLGAWLLALTGAGAEGEQAPVFVPIASSFNTESAAPEEFAALVGWSVLDVDTYIEQATPPATFAAVTGDFDDETLSDDLIDAGDGIVTDKDAEDFEQDIANVTALNRIGAPVRLAQQDDRMALSTSTPAVQAWLEGGATLADDEAFAGVAEALDTRDVVSAMLVEPSGGNAEAPGIPDDPVDAVGIGWSVEDDQPLVHAAYHFDSEPAAEVGSGTLEALYRDGTSVVTGEPFSQRMTVESVDTLGTTVLVSVAPTSEGQVSDLARMLTSQDLLFVSR